MRLYVLATVIALAGLIFLAPAGPSQPRPAYADPVACEDLDDPGLFLNTSVVTAEMLAAPVPHCRVEAYIDPTGESNIGIEVRLPIPEDWNGKFLALGGGGWSGSFSGAFGTGLGRGYATVSTDTGHKSGDPTQENWQLNPDNTPADNRIEDFNWRSLEQMTIIGKAIVQAHYDDTIDLSYWQGCSTGGRQGMLLSQRYPEFYDGMIVGAPVFTTLLQVNGLWRNSFTTVPNVFLTTADQDMVVAQILDRYDALDGVEDGFLGDPERVHDWSADDIVGLPEDKVNIFANLYQGAHQTGGTQVYFGYAIGGERQWDGARSFSINNFGAVMLRNLVKHDPTYDVLDWDIDTDLEAFLNAPNLATYNADDPDIREFVANGGKMIMYHGWNDDGPNPYSTIDYYNQVEEIVGKDKDLKTGNPGSPAERVRESVRLFMAPGMDHCGGGPGVAPSAANLLTALEMWVEGGDAPDRIIARNNAQGFERPLCPYPEVALYTGEGDTTDAGNFICVAASGVGAGSQGQ